MQATLLTQAKTFKFAACILIGWLVNTLREPANQNACLKVKSQTLAFPLFSWPAFLMTSIILILMETFDHCENYDSKKYKHNLFANFSFIKTL